MKGDYKGAIWAKVVKGRCSKHGCMVGSVTGLCFECHREQLEGART